MGFAAQEADADGMKGADGQLLQPLTQKVKQALFHLAGRLVGKGDGHDAVWLTATLLHHIGHPLGENAGLATARTSQN